MTRTPSEYTAIAGKQSEGFERIHIQKRYNRNLTKAISICSSKIFTRSTRHPKPLRHRDAIVTIAIRPINDRDFAIAVSQATWRTVRKRMIRRPAEATFQTGATRNGAGAILITGKISINQ